ncbi:MAG TPA: hypothetical protein VJC39_00980 [Candidatus Nanoarchaeia archaeon]|nr:hypothetical protein [Candidatus Nanoarchaeia archaeon]
MARRSNKKRMTEDQEFQIMKLVLDKFLWLGFIVMGWGMYLTVKDLSILPGLWYMVAGAVLLVLFMILIIKDYEVFWR